MICYSNDPRKTSLWNTSNYFLWMNEQETFLSIASVSWKAELLLIQFNTNFKPISSSQLNTTRNKDTQNLFEKRRKYTGHYKVMKVVPINILSTKNCTNCKYQGFWNFLGWAGQAKSEKVKTFQIAKFLLQKLSTQNA